MTEKIKVVSDMLEANDRMAEQNRKLFADAGVTVINLMGSPGAGKTAILEATLENLKEEFNTGVIEGDIETSRDAARLKRFGIPVVQINTRGACHLDAGMINSALEQIELEQLDLLIIENVGNLVCPAEFKVGEEMKGIVLSIPEGDDKPEKYPLMFREAGFLLLNKIDLLEHTNFDLAKFRDSINKINPELRLFSLSATSGEGLEQWTGWLRELAGGE